MHSNSRWTQFGHMYTIGVWFGVDPRIGTKKTCVKKIELRAQNMQTIHSRLDSQHDWGDLYDHLTTTRNLHCDDEWDILMSSKNHKKTGFGHDLRFSGHVALISCFISYEKWSQTDKFPSKAPYTRPTLHQTHRSTKSIWEDAIPLHREWIYRRNDNLFTLSCSLTMTL